MSEQPRPAASTDEHTYLLSVEEAADRYAAAGHPRTIHAIQKCCLRGDLESQKVETTYGELYLITPASINRHIAMIMERSQTNVRERPRPDVSVRMPQTQENPSDEQFATGREEPRPNVANDQYVEQLKQRLSEKDGEIGFLRSEVTVKNEQIKDLTERARETNHLIARNLPATLCRKKRQPTERATLTVQTSSTWRATCCASLVHFSVTTRRPPESEPRRSNSTRE
jgi:hypothetical protein